jgi:TatD DNase family protein
MLVDSHCHLDFKDFDGELDAVIGRARERGVGTMVTICTRVSEFDRVRRIAEQYEDIYCSVGIHPHEAASEPDTDVDQLVELAGHPKVVGIGEAGLDFYYDHSPRERQREVFQTHIEAARQTGLPLIVHSRNADPETVEMLEGNDGRLRGVIHCFSSTAHLAENAVKLGFFISLSGIITFKNAVELREIAGEIPIDRLLVETDSPYLAPVPHRGRRNEPAFVADTAAFVAGLRAMTPEDLAGRTTANFFQLFNKAKRPARS